MPKTAPQTFVWSDTLQQYELHTPGQPGQTFHADDAPAFAHFLETHTSFAFVGQRGRLSVRKEARPRGTGYWYASHKQGRRTRKRYLGRANQVTFARLEEVAQALGSAPSSANVNDLPPPAFTPVQRGSVVSDVPRETSPSSSRSNEHEAALLLTKFSIPRQPNALVMRERLLQILDTAFARPLTLLSASAGWGKTTLLSSWASRHSRQVAWISLDELDNNPLCFWISLIVALRRCDACSPSVGTTVLAMLQSVQPPALTGILSVLINELFYLSHEVLLFLDDYQVIHDPTIHESLTFLLEHLPPRLHLVLASRIDPDFPLARWRARGHLSEIRATDLRFTTAEVAAFLTQTLGEALAPEDMVLLEQRTEGWIAGLQLATLALRGREDRSTFVQTLTGNHRYLQDYMQEEILQRQPPAIQSFLLQTAVLTHMNAALCEALTCEPASQEILETLERNNLFVVPLDEQRQWYRLHDLFRDVLLARLHAKQAERVPRLHQRAAHWYEQQGDIREAVPHALAARDYPYAVALMEQEAPRMWRHGEAQLLHTWIMALPEEIVRAHARLALTSALHLLRNTQYMPDSLRAQVRTQVEQIIAIVERAMQDQQEEVPLSDAERILLSNRIRLLRGWQTMREAYLHNEAQFLREISQELQQLVEGEELHWKITPLFSLIMSLNLLGEVAAMLPLVQELKTLAQQTQDQYLTIRTMQWLAATYLEAGFLRRSHQECLDALALLDQMGGQITIQGYLYFNLVDLHLLWNQVAEAQVYLQKVMQYALAWQHLDLLAWGYCATFAISLANGDLAGAEQAFQEADHLVRQHGITFHLPRVTAIRVSLWQAQGNLAEASAWADLTPFHPETLNHTYESAYRALVSVYLTQRKYAQALEVLAPLLLQAERDQRGRDAMQMLALQVLAFQGMGASIQARDSLARLLALTEPEGCISVYLDAGVSMKHVLEMLLAESRENVHDIGAASRAFVSQILNAFEQRKKLQHTPHASLTQTDQAVHVPARVVQGASPLVEPLTRREREVLRLLAEGASNQQIADALVIQLPTVKKHISNLLAKLGAENRTQALARAQAASLL